MAKWHEAITKEDVATDALEVILPPRDLGDMPKRAITCENAQGGAALADAEIEVGPTAYGPWISEDLSESDIPTLSAGASAAYRMDSADRYLRVRAQAAGANCDLTVYLDALG